MNTAPPLILTQEQAARLLAYIQMQRRHALTQLAPSAERNTNQRFLQMIQGKLIHEMDQPAPICYLFLSSDEMLALKTMVADLLLLFAGYEPGEQRNGTLLDLAELKAMVEKMCRQSSPLRMSS